MTDIKYPKEIASVVRTQTFCVNNELSRATVSDGCEPLKFYSPYSRFIFSLINENKKSVTANVPATEIANIIQRTNYANVKHLDELSKNTSHDLSPAYTVKISAGRLKGKTPAEVLLNNPEDKELLKTQYKWLSDNLKKYPKNKEQMDAIDDASKLMQAGKLDKENVVTSEAPILLYEAYTRPLTSRPKNKSGNTFVYEINIKWYPGEDYPINITIENYYCPVAKDKETGKLIVYASKKEQSTKVNMALSAAEWNNTMYMIQANMRTFEQLSASNCYKEAIETDKQNRLNHNKQQTN